ncbi:MAG: riboflavin synthase [Planctomycetota bacterium]|nr:riboflavin synthase [Planctomycetota bacterium]
MFTGLIQHQGTLLERTEHPSGVRLVVGTDEWAHRPDQGDSIAINGCCLTVVEADEETLQFDAIPTTLNLTTIGTLPLQSRVNLEHAATPTTLLGGHLVQGHVEAQGTVLSNETDPERGWLLKLEVPEAVGRFMIEKGSIAIDGVSLTIATLEGTRVEVALIPETLDRTNLRGLQAGDRVNLESDCLAKMVGKLLERTQTPGG